MIRSVLFLFVVGSPLWAADAKPQFVEGKLVVPKTIPLKDVRIVVGGGDERALAERPALLGEWTTIGDQHLFTPQFPFKANIPYRVYLGAQHYDLQIVAAKPKAATLVGMYPSATTLPENVFRFYIQFDQPMPRGDVYKYLSVVQSDGKLVDQPFLELDDELWNDTQTRVTVFVDPGRIKREVKPLIDLGPVFLAKHEYTLVVSGKWPTLAGTPLGKDYRRKVSISSRLDGELETKHWRLTAPTREAPELTLSFDRSMDYALLQHTLHVRNAQGQAMEGSMTIGADEKSWRFRPKQPLPAGQYSVRVATILEDVCGNAVGRAFEVDLTAPPKPATKRPPYVDLPFTVLAK